MKIVISLVCVCSQGSVIVNYQARFHPHEDFIPDLVRNAITETMADGMLGTYKLDRNYIVPFEGK